MITEGMKFSFMKEFQVDRVHQGREDGHGKGLDRHTVYEDGSSTTT